MKLWNKGFEPNELIEQFTVGNDRQLDLRLAKFDIQGSMAHIRMLNSIGLLETDELEELLKELQLLYEQAERGEFEIEDGVEDIHSQVELMLTRKLGDMGKKIHSGRSRNDQVLVDLKLLMRDEIREIASSVEALFKSLQALSERYKSVMMPGYTHNQIAMPSSFGLWFGAYAETLIDDVEMLAAAYRIANQNPLGSAAGYGSSFPLDRQMTTDLLCFRTLHYNVVAAQMSRGKTEKALAAAVGAIATTIGKFAGDVCQFMCQNFGFVRFPDEYTTGSSIMPHKKNPDVFEVMRAKCNRLISLQNELALMTANLPLGYNRDYQLMKDVMFPATTELLNCLHIAAFMLEHIQVNEHILDDPKYDYLFTVEDVNRLVLQGVPFREAYRQIGMAVQNGEYKPTRQVNHTHLGSIGNPANDLIAEKMNEALKQFKS